MPTTLKGRLRIDSIVRHMSQERHIVHAYNKTTQGEKNKNEQPTKRSPNKTNQRTPRHDSTPTPQKPTHARLPNHNQHKKKLRRLLRTQHRLPIIRHAGKERTSKKPMGHDPRKTTQSLRPHTRRTKPTIIHRKLPKPHHKNPNKNLHPRNSRPDALPILRPNKKKPSHPSLNPTTHQTRREQPEPMS
jgi:hypothetical protein